MFYGNDREIMRKILLIIVIASLFSCEDEPKTFKGYIVCKEYVPEHMSNETPPRYNYAAVVPHPVIVHQTPPHKVEAEYVWYLANKYEVKSFRVNKGLFNKYKCGTLIHWNY